MDNLMKLMKETNARISLGDKWLVYDETIGMWTVYQKRYYSKKLKVLCAVTDIDLDNAINIMRDENV